VTASAAAQPLSVAGARARLNRTPARLRFAAATLAATAIVFGVVATTAATSRRDAARSVASSSEPQLVRAESVYASLSDADATAATTFLTGGIEPAARRARYLADIQAASARLEELSRRAGTARDIRAAAAVLSTQLPVYTGLVEAARSNNRQGFPVGAAYLRRASELMRTRMLPAAEHLYVVEAQRADADYRDGTRNTALIVAIALGGLLLIGLVITQVAIGRFSNRILNIPMLVATVVLVGVGAWIVVALVSEQDALAKAQREGSDSVQLLSASRVMALRAQRDESLALIGRGSDTTSVQDFDRTLVALRPLLTQAERVAARSGTQDGVFLVEDGVRRVAGLHAGVAARERRGAYTNAVRAYVGRELPQAERLDAALEAQTAAAQRRFAHHAGDATNAVKGLRWAIPVLAIAIALLALQGLAPRIREYR
jgi:hypothetical protein